MLGCHTEFIKSEGITFSIRRRQIYTSMSFWSSGAMLSSVSSSGALNNLDIGGSNQISLPAQQCGCVYYADVDASYSAINFNALVCGQAQPADANGNTCSTSSIAAPDNLSGARQGGGRCACVEAVGSLPQQLDAAPFAESSSMRG